MVCAVIAKVEDHLIEEVMCPSIAAVVTAQTPL